MDWTRLEFDAVLKGRVSGPMSAAEISLTPGIDGTIAAFNDPIAEGLRRAGTRPSRPNIVTDADIANARASDEELILAIAELRCLRTALATLNLVTVRTDKREERWDEYRATLAEQIKQAQKVLDTRFAIDLGTLGSGSIQLDFVTTDNPADPIYS